MNSHDHERIACIEQRLAEMDVRLNEFCKDRAKLKEYASRISKILDEMAASDCVRKIDGDPWWPEPAHRVGDAKATPDTVRIPAETIAEANAESSFIGGITHEKGTGYPITESDESKRIAEAVANTPHSC